MLGRILTLVAEADVALFMQLHQGSCDLLLGVKLFVIRGYYMHPCLQHEAVRSRSHYDYQAWLVLDPNMMVS